jgi:hypothetical protein
MSLERPRTGKNRKLPIWHVHTQQRKGDMRLEAWKGQGTSCAPGRHSDISLTYKERPLETFYQSRTWFKTLKEHSGFPKL